MTKLIYITHPQVIIDPNVPIEEWSVSEDGWDAFERLLKLDFWNDVDILYSSEENKAKQVAEKAIQKFDLKVFNNSNLNELDRSATGTLPFEEYMKAVKFTYGNPDKSFRGWETLDSSFQRNTKTIEEIGTKNKNKTIGVIGHGSAGTLIKCWIKGIEPSFDEDPQTTGCYFIADLDKKEVIQDWKKY